MAELTKVLVAATESFRPRHQVQRQIARRRQRRIRHVGQCDDQAAAAPRILRHGDNVRAFARLRNRQRQRMRHAHLALINRGHRRADGGDRQSRFQLDGVFQKPRRMVRRAARDGGEKARRLDTHRLVDPREHLFRTINQPRRRLRDFVDLRAHPRRWVCAQTFSRRSRPFPAFITFAACPPSAPASAKLAASPGKSIARPVLMPVYSAAKPMAGGPTKILTARQRSIWQRLRRLAGPSAPPPLSPPAEKRLTRQVLPAQIRLSPQPAPGTGQNASQDPPAPARRIAAPKQPRQAALSGGRRQIYPPPPSPQRL